MLAGILGVHTTTAVNGWDSPAASGPATPPTAPHRTRRRDLCESCSLSLIAFVVTEPAWPRGERSLTRQLGNEQIGASAGLGHLTVSSDSCQTGEVVT